MNSNRWFVVVGVLGGGFYATSAAYSLPDCDGSTYKSGVLCGTPTSCLPARSADPVVCIAMDEIRQENGQFGCNPPGPGGTGSTKCGDDNPPPSGNPPVCTKKSPCAATEGFVDVPPHGTFWLYWCEGSIPPAVSIADTSKCLIDLMAGQMSGLRAINSPRCCLCLWRVLRCVSAFERRRRRGDWFPVFPVFVARVCCWLSATPRPAESRKRPRGCSQDVRPIVSRHFSTDR